MWETVRAAGNQAPATTDGIVSSLEDMATSMGEQADRLHEGYMQTRGQSVLNPKMTSENKKRLTNMNRGLSFKEATGYQGKLQSAKDALKAKLGLHP